MASSEPIDWQALIDTCAATKISGRLIRLVESQEQVATLALVGNDHRKQHALELLLERSKPPYMPATEHLDYLLRTPWRYPPLYYGSRFGRLTQRSIFYGALSQGTALAESAYYRWVFYFDQQRTKQKAVVSQHSMFEAQYHCEDGYQLQKPPFQQHEILKNRSDYRESQALGSALRQAGAQGFEYVSARDPDQGLCVALLCPSALASQRARNKTNWICTTDANRVSFSKNEGPSLIVSYLIEDFTVNGKLAAPSS